MRSQKKHPTNTAYFVRSFYLLAQNAPAHTFVFIVTDTANFQIAESKNITVIQVKAAQNTLSEKLWNSYQLPKIIKKQNTNLLVSLDSTGITKTTIPQYYLINDLSAIKKRSTLFNSPEKIITTSTYSKTKIIEQLKIDEQKIAVIHTAADTIYCPISWEEKQEILNKHTNEKEYFLYNGKVDDANILIKLLKAFSLFKRWQKSNMQLLIATKDNSINTSFLKSLNTYKYKADVNILNGISEDELAKIYGSAYCLINPVESENYLPILQAMQSHIPVITGSNETVKELCNDAALYINIESVEDISKKMILIYKDENKRNEIITKGIAISGQYDIIDTISTLSQLLHL